MPFLSDIVVATDFSECSTKAVRQAVSLAKTLGARVHLVHSWVLPVVSADEAAIFTSELTQRIEADAEQAMEATLKTWHAELPSISGVVRSGDARDVVPAVAEELQAGLIVVGTHGRHGLRRVLLGSVAETIARTAPCSVLIVR